MNNLEELRKLEYNYSMNNDTRAEMAQELARSMLTEEQALVLQYDVENWELVADYWTLMDFDSNRFEDDYIATDELDRVIEDLVVDFERCNDRIRTTEITQ